MVVQTLPGVRLGRVSFGEPLVQGHLWRVKEKKKKKKKKKKGNMGITILPPRRFCFLILFSFCLLTVQLHFTPILNFQQSTHAQTKKKKSVFILFLSIVYIIKYIHFIIIIFFFFRKQTTHTHAHTKSFLGMLLIFLFYGLLPCCLVWR